MRVLRLGSPLVQDLLKLATQSHLRHSKLRCVVAGTKLVQDLGKRYPFHELLSSPGDDSLCEGLRAKEHHVADARSLRRIAQLIEFNGLVATLDLPTPTENLGDPRLILALDYIQDPGLLGTVLRTAVAFQWQAIFFLPHCVDPFSPSCIRASQGALFEIPHVRGKMEDLLKLCRKKSFESLCFAF